MIIIQDFMHSKATGQIATLLILMLAVVFLFVAITFNIGQLTQKKTALDIAADAAALRYASSVGSFVNMLAISNHLNPLKGKKCWSSWGLFFKMLANIVVTVVTIAAGYFGWLSGWKLWVARGANFLGGLANLGERMQESKEIRALNRQFKRMGGDLAPQLQEAALLQVLTAVEDDSIKVADDVDWDEDEKFGYDSEGKPNDKLSRFFKLYQQSLNTFVTQTIQEEFRPELDKEINDFVDNALKKFKDETTKMITNVWGEDKSLAGAGMTGFFALLSDLEAKGQEYDISFWRPGVTIPEPCPDEEQECPDLPEPVENDAVDGFKSELEDFNEWVNEITQMPSKDRTNTFAHLSLQLYDDIEMDSGEVDDRQHKDDWYGMSQQWSETLDDWKKELEEKRKKLNEELDMLRVCEQTEAGCSAEEEMLISQLNDLVNRINGFIGSDEDKSIGSFGKFQKAIAEFRSNIDVFVQAVVALSPNKVFTHALDRALLKREIVGGPWQGLFLRTQLTYSWPDQRGWHHIRVKAEGPSRMPTLKKDSGGGFFKTKKCIKIKGLKNPVTITVWRFDEDNPVFFANNKKGTLLWKFRSRKNINETIPTIEVSNPDAIFPKDTTLPNKYGIMHTLSQALYSPVLNEIRIIYTERSK